MFKVTIIVQARTGSKRLKNKMLLPFYNEKTILQIILERLKPKYNIVLATTDKIDDDSLCEIARKIDVPFYRGNEHNVLDRFIKASKYFNIKTIVRVCADNPFLSLDFIDNLVSKYKGEDYCSFCFDNNLPTILGHLGIFSEITTLDTLIKVSKLTKESIYLEHVTNYIYNNPDIFNVKLHSLKPLINNYQGIRLTVDTHNDFLVAKDLFLKFKEDNILDIQKMIDFIKSNNVFLKSMKLEIKNNSK